MATTYNRCINLYINGREVRNDIASIRAELNKLTAQQAHTIRGSAQYNANLLKIRQLREILNQHNMDLKYTSRAWSGLASFAGKLEHYQTLLFGMVAAFTGLISAAKSASPLRIRRTGMCGTPGGRHCWPLPGTMITIRTTPDRHALHDDRLRGCKL